MPQRAPVLLRYPAPVNDSPIPVTIVTGFLGAGKSTLVQRWLSELPRHETAVIVNEQGDVGIDGELLAAHVARLREISGGCICCSGQAALLGALAELSTTDPRPTRILVETSGAASPAGVIRAIGQKRARERLRLDGVLTVLDACRLQEILDFELAVEQLGFADVVVLSHMDQLSSPDDQKAALRTQIARYAPAAAIAFSSKLHSEGLVPLLEQRSEAIHLQREGSPHAVIESVSLIHEGELDEDRFADWVEDALGDVEARILRVKGILAMHGLDMRVIVQGVSQDVDVQLGKRWENDIRISRMVVLGLGLDHEALEAGFRRCAWPAL